MNTALWVVACSCLFCLGFMMGGMMGVSKVDKLVKSNDNQKWAVFRNGIVVGRDLSQEDAATIVQNNPGTVAKPQKG